MALELPVLPNRTACGQLGVQLGQLRDADPFPLADSVGWSEVLIVYRWWAVGGGWWMVDGGLWEVVGGGWLVAGSGRWVVVGGRWWMLGNGWWAAVGG